METTLRIALDMLIGSALTLGLIALYLETHELTRERVVVQLVYDKTGIDRKIDQAVWEMWNRHLPWLGKDK